MEAHHHSPLYFFQTSLSSLSRILTLVDDLVVNSRGFSSRSEFRGLLDVARFSESLSDSASSLREWIPQLENAARTQSLRGRDDEENKGVFETPCCKCNSESEAVVLQNGEAFNGMTEGDGTGKLTGAPVSYRLDTALDEGDHVSIAAERTLSDSPLVPYPDRVHFFMLTPMIKQKRPLSEPSRRISAKTTGSLSTIVKSSHTKHEESCPSQSEIPSLGDLKNSSENEHPVYTSECTEVQQIDAHATGTSERADSYLRCRSKSFSGILPEDHLSAGFLPLLLTPRIRKPQVNGLDRQVSIDSLDSTISDSPIHLCKDLGEQESLSEFLSTTPAIVRHRTQGSDSVIPSVSTGSRGDWTERLPVHTCTCDTEASTSLRSPRLHICNVFDKFISGAPSPSSITTPANVKPEMSVIEHASPLPFQSLIKRYSSFYEFVDDDMDAPSRTQTRISCKAEAISGPSTPYPVANERLCITLVDDGTDVSSPSLIERYSSYIGSGSKDVDDLSETGSENMGISCKTTSAVCLRKSLPGRISETPVYAQHKARTSDVDAPQAPQSLVKRYTNFVGSKDVSRESSSFRSSNDENGIKDIVVLDPVDHNKVNHDEETKQPTISINVSPETENGSPLEQIAQPLGCGNMEALQSLMKRYSRFLYQDDDGNDAAIQLTPVLAAWSPPKTCMLMRPNQTNDGTQPIPATTIETPFRTSDHVGEKIVNHEEDMELISLQKPNQFQRVPETTAGTPSSDMQFSTMRKRQSITRTPLAELQFSTIRKPGAPLPGEQTLKRELWSRMEAEFASMGNVCKSLFTENQPDLPQNAKIANSELGNRKLHADPRNKKPSGERPFVPKRQQKRGSRICN